MNETITKVKWGIDPVHSEIGFKVKHLMITIVKGTFIALLEELRQLAHGHPGDHYHNYEGHRNEHVKFPLGE